MFQSLLPRGKVVGGVPKVSLHIMAKKRVYPLLGIESGSSSLQTAILLSAIFPSISKYITTFQDPALNDIDINVNGTVICARM
jgi:hypothetical protein